MRSSKKKKAKMIVDTGPKLPNREKVGAPNRFMAAETKKEGIKVGMLRPITLWPFPKKEINELVEKGIKGFLSVEMSAGQMVEDVQLVVSGRTKVEHFGRYGGVIHSPEEVLEALKNQIIGG